MKVYNTSFTLATDERTEISDITKLVRDSVQQFAVTTGIALVNTLHTTCALFVNESQKALVEDIQRFLEDTVARDHYYRHNDPEHSDCDRANADSHLRALLLGHSLTLQISGGEVVLGQWQRLLMAELDGPRTRTIRVQVIGIKS